MLHAKLHEGCWLAERIAQALPRSRSAHQAQIRNPKGQLTMKAYKPEEADKLLQKALLQDGDLDAAVALYEPDAVFVVPPGRVVTGHAAIREVLQGMIGANATGSLDSVTAVESVDGTVAVTRTKGTTTSPGPDGKPVSVPFHSVEVVRKQPDGTWLIAIDDPSGEGLT